MDKVELTPIEQFVIDKVREIRKERGFSQRDIAYEIDIDQSFLAAIESPKGRAKYNLNHLNDLAKLFKCSPKDFLPDQPF
jgi:transcriptional regulator with XRE-family HTH domain